MLDILRRGANTLVAKLLMGVVGGSFVIWGVGDVVRSGFGRAAYAIKVGDITYGPQAVRQQFDRDFARYQQRYPSLTIAQAVQMGMVDQTVQRLASEGALQAAANDLGTVATDDAVRQQIFTNRAFFNDKGQFNRDIFLQVLQQNQLTEAGYVNDLRLNLIRNRLIAPAESSGAAPQVLVDALYRYQQEKRGAGILRIDAASQVVTATPDDTALQTIYQNHIAVFTQPEYRTFSVIPLTVESVSKSITVSDQDIADAYKADPSAYALPERRSLSLVMAGDQAIGKGIVEAAKTTAGLASAAEAAKMPAPIPLDNQTAAALPAPIADAVFKLKEGEIAGPFQTAFGWQVFGVTKITPAEARALEAVRDEIRTQLIQTRAGDRLNDASSALQDALGSGDSLEAAAKKLNLPILTISPVSARNTTPDGKPAAGLPTDALGKQIIAAGFAQPQGEAARVVPAGNDAFVAVRVDHVTPAQPKPLADVRADVVTLWQAEQRQKQAEALAKDLAAQLPTASDPKALAAAHPGVTWSVSNPITREGKGNSTLPADVVAALFKLPAKDAKTPATQASAVPLPTEKSPGAAVVMVDSVIAADPAAAAGDVGALADSLKADMGRDLTLELTDAFRHRYNASVNQAVVKSAF